jgi:hypothetical protein
MKGTDPTANRVRRHLCGSIEPVAAHFHLERQAAGRPQTHVHVFKHAFKCALLGIPVTHTRLHSSVCSYPQTVLARYRACALSMG